MLKLLPHWRISNITPAFYDTESATAIEMTAKIYAKVNELVADYNEFVDRINKEFNETVNSTNKDFELFRVSLRQEFQDFIDIVNIKYKGQETFIQDMYEKMIVNLSTELETITNNLIASGDIAVGLSLNESTEELTLTTSFDKLGSDITDIIAGDSALSSSSPWAVIKNKWGELPNGIIYGLTNGYVFNGIKTTNSGVVFVVHGHYGSPYAIVNVINNNFFADLFSIQSHHTL